MRDALAKALPPAIIISSMLFFVLLSKNATDTTSSLTWLLYGTLMNPILIIGQAAYFRYHAKTKQHSILYAIVYTLFFVPYTVSSWLCWRR